MIINECPTCGQKLREIIDDDGVFIARRCDRCGCNWSIFQLTPEAIFNNIEKTHQPKQNKNNLEKWL